jgi:5-hydroxyisourate hydrolase-like protein (transthyretin family)
VKTLLLLIAALPAMAAIEGTVVNKTTGKPQPGVQVTLTQLTDKGMQPAASGVSDAQGRFKIEANAASAHLIQARYQNVSYSSQLQPNQPQVEIAVYDAVPKVSAAEVTQHMILLETDGQELVVNETVIYSNDSQTTWYDPKGTARFYIPSAAGENRMARAIAPGGLPVDRPLLPAGERQVFAIDFPVKPGETRFDLSYKLSAQAAGTLGGRVMHDGPARLVVPQGIKVEGAGLEPAGAEPSTGAAIYTLKDRNYSVKVSGTGQLRRAEPTQPSEEDGPRIQIMQPPGYQRSWKLFLGLALAALMLAFAAHYLRGHAAASGAGGGARR